MATKAFEYKIGRKYYDFLNSEEAKIDREKFEIERYLDLNGEKPSNFLTI